MKELIEVFAYSEKQRTIISQGTIDTFFWRGNEGFHNRLTTIIGFYQKHLHGIEFFDKTILQIAAIVKEIPKEDFDNQVISIAKYKDKLYNLINIIENFEQQVLHYFSFTSIFQFSNSTFNSDILFSSIESVFEPKTWEFIPETAKSDIEEGAKSLLFNLPTAASFMFLRAAEDRGCTF